MSSSNFTVKNGLNVGGQEIIDSTGKLKGAAGNFANAAFDAANSATNIASTAQNNINTLSGYLSSNVSTLNSSISSVNVSALAAFAAANTAQNNITPVSIRADGAFVKANAAFDAANVGQTFVNSGGTINGSVTISQDLSVTGNITLGGSSTSISSNNLTLSDPLIYLATGNSGNTADIGIVGHFTQGNYQHTAVFRDHTDGRWKFVSNVISEPSSTITLDANSKWDIIKSGGLETTGYANIGTTVFAGSSNGSPLGGATNPIFGALASANNYAQSYILNTANGSSTSADVIAYPNNGTDTSGWIDMGITSNNYSDAAYSVTGRNEGYLFMSAPSGVGTSGNLVVATDSTGTYNAIEFITGGFNKGKTNSNVKITTATTTSSNTTGTLQVQGGVGIKGSLFVDRVISSSVAMAALNIDCSTGNYFTKTISGDSTFTVSNVPTGSYSFVLRLTHTSGTVTWFTGTNWPSATAPTLTTGKTHLFVFTTDDGGTTWRASALANYTS